jgi:hypothetical protein
MSQRPDSTLPPVRRVFAPARFEFDAARLTRAIKCTYQGQRVTRSHQAKIEQAVAHVQRTVEVELRALSPARTAHVRVQCFGSVVTGLASRFGSDVDLSVEWSMHADAAADAAAKDGAKDGAKDVDAGASDASSSGLRTTMPAAKEQLRLLRNAVKCAGTNWGRVHMIATARVPVLKMRGHVRPVGALDVDVCVNQPHGVVNSALIRLYMRADPRVLPLTFVVKRWAKRPGLISDSAHGRLSSYAVVLMVIFYLQRVGVLPCLHDDDAADDDAADDDADDAAAADAPSRVRFGTSSFIDDEAWIRASCVRRRRRHTASTGELLVGLMAFYGHEFRPATHVVSIARGGRDTTRRQVTAEAEVAGTPLPARRAWWIEDPFQAATGFNPAQAVHADAADSLTRDMATITLDDDDDDATATAGTETAGATTDRRRRRRRSPNHLTCSDVHAAFERAWRSLTTPPTPPPTTPPTSTNSATGAAAAATDLASMALSLTSPFHSGGVSARVGAGARAGASVARASTETVRRRSHSQRHTSDTKHTRHGTKHKQRNQRQPRQRQPRQQRQQSGAECVESRANSTGDGGSQNRLGDT